MAAKYLLPCHNGKTVIVTTADAGRMVDCPCGKKVAVPTLRSLHDLARADASDAPAPKPTWSARQGAMFTGGLCLALVGLIAMGVIYNRFRKIDAKKPEVDQKLVSQLELAAENAEAVTTLEAWESLKSNPLEERPLLIWEANRKVANEHLIYLGAAGAVVLLGLALAVAGPLMAPPTARPPATKRLSHPPLK